MSKVDQSLGSMLDQSNLKVSDCPYPTRVKLARQAFHEAHSKANNAILDKIACSEVGENMLGEAAHSMASEVAHRRLCLVRQLMVRQARLHWMR